MNMKTGLFIALGVVTVWFIGMWWKLAKEARERHAAEDKSHHLYHSICGFVFGFLDTLGIGNFAPTTSAFKLRGSVPDEHIPGTLNVGYALPTVAQAFIYVAIIEVDVWTLVLMTIAAVAGAWLGAGIVARWPRRKIQIGMGFALVAAAVFFSMKNLGLFPAGEGTLSLTGAKLALGLAGNFALGALMTLGIGLYAPCLILVGLLGMVERTAFPIMMASCAFLMPFAGYRFIRAGSYSKSAAMSLTIVAIPAVLIAAYIVESMPLEYVRWLVVVVVLYTSFMMLRSAFTEQKTQTPEKAATPAS